MDPIEQRLSTSLHERAEDVEATPHLWQEVDRRLRRRQRWTAWSWIAASATAAIAAVLIVPDLLSETAGPEVAERPAATEDPATEDPAVTEGPEATDDAAAAGPGPLLLGAGREVRLTDGDGATLASYVFPEEGESTVAGLAVRPGSSATDLTAAVITTAEGMYDLRILSRDGEDLTLEVVDDPAYRPGEGAGAGLRVSGPVWAPDGTSLAWLEEDESGVRLRTIGWEDGPGTGATATDNAVFALEGGAPSPLELMDFSELGPGRFLLRATTHAPGDGWYELELLRQADGAWALAPEAQLERIAAPATSDGPVRALAGVIEPEDGSRVQPAWLVRQGEAGPVAVRQDPTGRSREFALPPDLLGPDDEAAPAWAVALDDGVIVSSSSTETAAFVDGEGDVRLLEGRATYVSALR